MPSRKREFCIWNAASRIDPERGSAGMK